jgi:signal transduction histidine kinase
MFSPRASLFALLGLTAISSIVLIGLGWRSLDAFESTIVRVLRQVSVYTAEQTAQQIQRDLRSPVFDLLEQVDHAAIRRFDVPAIAKTLEAASPSHFQLIDTYFVWSFSKVDDPEFANAALEDRALFYSRSAERPAGAMPAPSAAASQGFFIDPPLASVLAQEAEKWMSYQKAFSLTYIEYGGKHYQVVLHYLLANSGPRLPSVEGFLADPEHLRKNYFGSRMLRWRPKADAAPSPELALSIFDSDGREWYRTGRSLAERYDASAEFPFLFFETGLFDSLSPFHPEVKTWTVRTGYESGAIAAIARQQTSFQRFAGLLVGFVAAIGVGLTARSAVREMHLSEIRSDFVASVSHDLKTPLAKIQLYAETLESGRARSQEKFDAYCRVIKVQARKLTQLIQELLDFSRIEAGVREYVMDELDLGQVLRSTLEMFETELSQDGCTSEIVIPDEPVRVLGSEEGLQQLLANLISNALKYSPGDRYVRVVLSSDERQARIEVTDHGIGVPRGEYRRIFKKFYRSPAAASAASGSGIGLAIVDHVIRAHGGTVDIHSGPVVGTTFTVRLPLVATNQEVWV